MSSHLEPPTVTMRPPPSQTPDLPLSPPPSRLGRALSLDDEVRDSSGERKVERESPRRTESDDAGERTTLGDRDGEGRLKQRKRERTRQPRWRRLAQEWKLYMTLENSGSVARDHLASERTFLAYARTSLTIASTGVALVQLFTLSAVTTNKDLERFARPLGAVMIIMGLYTLAVGVLRYFLVQDALIRGVYPVARISAGLLSFMMVSLVIVVFVIILVATPR